VGFVVAQFAVKSAGATSCLSYRGAAEAAGEQGVKGEKGVKGLKGAKVGAGAREDRERKRAEAGKIGTEKGGESELAGQRGV
jgi:hypothetical protein